MKIALIANPHSGGKIGKKLIPEVEKKLSLKKISYDLLISEYHEHIYEIVKPLTINNYDAIVSLGGDGTNYQVLNSLLKYHSHDKMPALGIIPVGRGNSFARDLDIFSVDNGINALCNERLKEVDVCCYTQGQDLHYFINLMGFGFVTDAADTASKFGWMGDFSYIVGVLYHTIKLSFHNITLEIDEKIIKKKNCFVEFYNSKYTGGNMLMAPDAEIDNGYFDIVILSPFSRASLISSFPKLFKGKHGDNPAIRFIKAKKAKIYAEPEKKLLPDGEMTGTTPTEITILPKLVRYFH